MDDQTCWDASTAEIAALFDLSLTDLRSVWRAHYSSDPPKRMSRELMARAIGYRRQEKALGGLNRRVKAKLKVLAGGKSARGNAKTRSSAVHLKPGSQLVRQWGGRVHIVTTESDGGFIYQDKRYGSLSAIARTITGARWSGPAFFGLKTKRAGSASLKTPTERTKSKVVEKTLPT
jgi:hypothetical protein